MGVNGLPKTVTRQRRGCDLNPGPAAPESSTLTTRLLDTGLQTIMIRDIWQTTASSATGKMLRLQTSSLWPGSVHSLSVNRAAIKDFSQPTII